MFNRNHYCIVPLGYAYIYSSLREEGAEDVEKKNLLERSKTSH